MLYLIDGYNLLFSGAGRRPRDPEELGAARGDLVRLLQRLHAARRGRSIVVFDCRKPFFLFGLPRRQRFGDVEVRFAAADSSADDHLRALIRETKDAQAATVVTSDREILDAAEARGMRMEGAKAFWRRLTAEPPAGDGGPPRGAKKPGRGAPRRGTPAPPEPDVKREGIPASDVEYWMREFGIVKDEPGE
jgi:predicted RNA-binding protein with PIN domain